MAGPIQLPPLGPGLLHLRQVGAWQGRENSEYTLHTEDLRLDRTGEPLNRERALSGDHLCQTPQQVLQLFYQDPLQS